MNSSDRRLFNKIPPEIEDSILEFLPTFYISTYQDLPNTFFFDGQSNNRIVNNYYKLFMSDIQFFTFHKSIRKKVSIISYNLFTSDIYFNQKINFIKIILNEHFESYIPSYKYLDFYILKNNKFIKLFNLDRYNKVNNLSFNDLSYYLSTPSPYMEIPISNYDKIKNKRKSPNKLLQVIYILYLQSM